MIDIEHEVYQRIVNKLTSAFPNIYTYGEGMPSKARFPCVIIEEADNYAYDKTQDSASLENHAVVMYEVNIYSNKVNGKKDECKKIQKIIDCQFEQMGFTRISKTSMSINNATVYRIISRYQAVASKNKEIFRR